MQACIMLPHTHADTHRDHGSHTCTLCSVTDRPRQSHHAVAAPPTPCDRSRTSAFDVESSDDPVYRVCVWLDAHLIAEWIGRSSKAEDGAALLSSQFPSLRLSREPVLDPGEVR